MTSLSPCGLVESRGAPSRPRSRDEVTQQARSLRGNLVGDHHQRLNNCAQVSSPHPWNWLTCKDQVGPQGKIPTHNDATRAALPTEPIREPDQERKKEVRPLAQPAKYGPSPPRRGAQRGMTLGTEYDIKHRHELDRQDLLLPGQIGPGESRAAYRVTEVPRRCRSSGGPRRGYVKRSTSSSLIGWRSCRRGCWTDWASLAAATRSWILVAATPRCPWAPLSPRLRLGRGSVFQVGPLAVAGHRRRRPYCETQVPLVIIVASRSQWTSPYPSSSQRSNDVSRLWSSDSVSTSRVWYSTRPTSRLESIRTTNEHQSPSADTPRRNATSRVSRSSDW